MKNYNPETIEKRWQKVWDKEKIYRAQDFSKKPKIYLLVEFPYPSGAGLHVGHCRSYTALDIISRKRRMQGFNVLFPMGWDAFGLPTENYAIQTGVHPQIVTKENTAFFKRQEKSLGLSFNWEREIATTDLSYYKWTQWIFAQLFKRGLAYKAKMPINWCPSCKIGLANEEVVEGACERCGTKVVKKEREQWMLRITKYAERLIKDLDKVDFPERVKKLQKDWIGKSEGVEIKFSIYPAQFSINVFTTRIDTIFGATYLVLAPEHPVIEEIKNQISNFRTIEKYIVQSQKKTEIERTSKTKEKTGVKLDGITAINPATGREIPIFIAEYVLMYYGTGAIMAVPAHDERDFDFAKNHNLPVVEVIKPCKKEPLKKMKKNSLIIQNDRFDKAYEGEGIVINSGRFDGLKSEVARKRMLEYFEKKNLAKRDIYYKLRDWIFSRQRYWGEPIPMIHCKKCGWVSVSEKELPVHLPQVKKYKPTEKGDSPLAAIENWVCTSCPKCKGPANRETDVMPNWAGSNWYYLRYCDPQNDKKLADPKKLRYWMPVDWYNGGMEHTTLHLLYSRFIYKFLWDIAVVPKSIGPEPYKKRTSHGIVLGERGIKMSKSKGNVVNPEDVIKQYGADTLRVYEMFMGPFEQMIAWDTKGVKGARRFLEKVWKGAFEFLASKKHKSSLSLKKLLHKTIKKVSEDIENLKFNTALSSLMEFTNEWLKNTQGLSQEDFKNFLRILAPFVPHITEELYQKLKNKKLAGFKSIFQETWPKYDNKLVREQEITLVIQINGKVRNEIRVRPGISETKAKKLALETTKIKKWVVGGRIKKTIFVKDRLINFVI